MTGSDIECYCYIAYLGPFWFIGLIADKTRDPKLRFHLNQGLVLFLAEVAAFVAAFFLGRLLSLVPYAGGILSGVLWVAAVGCAFWLSVRGMLNVASDRKRRLPLIGMVELLR